jgi:pimeloyl-ACP methyl ester carboxylesterase
VVLLHGLARTAASMERMEATLTLAGYQVENLDYPSRDANIEHLAGAVIPAGAARCAAAEASPVHFVTHSLGGILVRYYLASNRLENLGRVVMLGPPNQGSEVADALMEVPGYAAFNGPAGRQLGTDTNSIPRSLGPVDFPLGVVAGTQTINYLLSQLLPNPDDGKVSVESTKVDGMADHISLSVSHPFLMQRDEVIAQVLAFLAEGRFNHPSAGFD